MLVVEVVELILDLW